jgi:hypothetical protein
MLLCIYNITYHTTSLLSTSCTAITTYISLAMPAISLNDVMSVGGLILLFVSVFLGSTALIDLVIKKLLKRIKKMGMVDKLPIDPVK